MDGPMIAVLVVGSIATVAVAAATMLSYKDNYIGKSRSRDLIEPKYLPIDPSSRFRRDKWPIDHVQSRRDNYLENEFDDLDFVSAHGSIRDSARDSLRNSSYFNSGRDSLRNSYRRSSFGGKRKSRKKI